MYKINFSIFFSKIRPIERTFSPDNMRCFRQTASTGPFTTPGLSDPEIFIAAPVNLIAIFSIHSRSIDFKPGGICNMTYGNPPVLIDPVVSKACFRNLHREDRKYGLSELGIRADHYYNIFPSLFFKGLQNGCLIL